MSFHKDSPAEVDVLNRKQFANEIAQSLIQTFENGEDSFVFGLNGKWGSGKTTLMNYLKDSLNTKLGNDGNFIIFDFNPWMFSGRDELLSNFLKELSRIANPTNTVFKDIVEGLADAASYFRWAKYLNSTVGEWQKKAEDQLKSWSSAPTIRELKENVDEAIIKNQLRLFILIDDLDRLTPREVVDVFQIIKLNANFKNTVFVVAFDKENVQEVLNKEYGFNGERYLEKIIQVDYRIPDLLDETIESIFIDHLQGVLKKIDVEVDLDEIRGIWTVHRLKYYFTTLRDIYRYFNALKLRFPAIKKDVNTYQFLIIEAMRVFDYATYELIQTSYKKGIQYGPKTTASKLDGLISNENSKVLYNYLFEKNGSAKVLYSIADPQFFDRYFALAIGKFDISENLVLQFARDDKSRFRIVKQAIEDNSIRSFLVRISAINVGLEALDSLLRWPADSEQRFLDSLHEFIDAVAHIIECNGEVGNGLNYLMSIFRGSESHFNPAKFYLIYHFTSVDPTVMDKFFSKHYGMLRSNDHDLKKMELDILKRHENEYLQFSRADFKTDFFHKIFLQQYFKAYPEEYRNKLQMYFNQDDRALLFAGFLFQSYQGKKVVDPYWAKSLLDIQILSELDSRILAIKTQVFSSSNLANRDLYLAQRDEILNLVKSFETSTQNVPKKRQKSSDVKSRKKQS